MTSRTRAELAQTTTAEAVIEVLGSVEGKRVIDIGCGEGGTARLLAAHGAEVVGFDPYAEPTDWIEEGSGRYRLAAAAAGAIPEGDACADLVLFVFSLHHVPAAELAGALAEARRLLRPKGRLCVVEPVAEGPGQYVMEPYHDETAARAAALAALQAHAKPAFEREEVLHYSESRQFPDFATYAQRAISKMGFNGYTEADVLAPEVRRRFEEMYSVHSGRLDQPVRINLYS